MLACTKFIPKSYSGAVCARFFATSTQENDGERWGGRLLNFQKKEAFLLERIKETGISSVQARMSQLGQNIRLAAIVGLISGAACVSGSVIGIYVSNLLTGLKVPYPVSEMVGSAATILIGIELTAYGLVNKDRITKRCFPPISKELESYNSLKTSLEEVRSDIRSLHSKLADRAINSYLPDLFD